MKAPLFLAVVTAGLSAAALAHAQVPASGTFTAKQACPATTSIRDATNSGGASVQPGQSYRLVGKNKPDATYFQIIVDGTRRWVDIQCGAADAQAASPSAVQSPSTRASYVLAMSWEPAFCNGHGDKAECATAAGAAAQSLSLHGLWPQPRGRAYCNVDPASVRTDKAHQWERLPEPDIRPETKRRLAAIMPGVQSDLQRHEWIVHGTCSGLPADTYFNRAADLAEQVNASSIPAAFTANLGRSLSADAIGAAFDQAFGPGAASRVTILCQGSSTARRLVELDIALAGDVTGAAPLPDLIRAAAPVPASCPGGLVVAPRP